jgi:hypothetical protein
MGDSPGSTEQVDGILDEVRVSDTGRSAAWIRTEYLNQYSPSTFYTISSDESTSSIGSCYEWVEIYNSGVSSIDLSSWNLTNHNGARFSLTGAGSISSGGYLVCHLGQSGTNSSTNVYGAISGGYSSDHMFNYSDGMSLLNNNDDIVDYIAWGSDPDSSDDSAVSGGIWSDGDYIDISSLSENQSFGRDKDSTDTNTSSDWEGPETNRADPFGVHSGSWTQGAQNYDQFIVINEVMFSPTGGPYDQDWGEKKKITIHGGQVYEDLTDFPMYFIYRDIDVANKAQSDGDDIMFVSSDLDTKLDHEMESYDSTTGEMIVWIKIPYLSATEDTIIYMYYNNSDCSSQENAQDVWGNGYVGVYHMSETTGPIANSVSSSNYGGRVNTPTKVSGQIGYGQEFTEGGEEDVFLLGDLGLCDGVNENITVSLWAKIDTGILSEGYGKLISKRNDADNDYVYNIQLTDTDPRQVYNSINGNSGSGRPITNLTWTYLTLTYDGSTKLMGI